MRPHPVPLRRARRPFAAALLAAALAVVALPAGPSGATESDSFTTTPGVDPILRYPMTMPVGGRVESLIGGGCPSARSHVGIDISSPQGSPTAVHAAYPGLARAIDTGNGYGLTVEVVHFGDDTRYLSRYAHLSAAAVPAEGRWVAQGEVVGTTGATGNAQTVHLHFEVRDAADGAIDLNPAFRPCRRNVVAGTALAVDLPGLVSPLAVAAGALAPNTWAATGVGPGATAPGAADCRYWDRATDRGDGHCDAGDAGDDGVDAPGVGVGIRAGG